MRGALGSVVRSGYRVPVRGSGYVLWNRDGTYANVRKLWLNRNVTPTWPRPKDEIRLPTLEFVVHPGETANGARCQKKRSGHHGTTRPKRSLQTNPEP